MGPENAAMRTALMDAAEAVMREQGYGAISARAVAARADVKYQIVFYYFATMDDLLVATYRRNVEKMWEAIEAALSSERPLHALWALWSHPFDGALALEFLAIANHNDTIRAEYTAFAKQLRRTLKQRLEEKGKRSPDGEVLSPVAISAVLTCVGSIMSFENSLGIKGDHSEVRALVGWALEQLEPPQNVKRGGRKKKVHA